MKYVIAEQALTDQINMQWPLQSITTPIIFENQGFDPNDPTLTAPYPPGGPWVLVEIFWAGERQVSFGGANGNLFAAHGELQIHCLVPENTGRGLASALFDQVCAIYRGLTLAIGTSGQVRCCGIKPATLAARARKEVPFWDICAVIDIIYEDLA
jgi:hypothetical protein